MSRQSYKLTKIGEIPIDWDVQNLEEISEDIFVGIATSTTEHYRQLGVPILRNQNIKEDKLDTKELLYISEEFSKKNKNKKLLAGDVIIVRTGYPGVSCVVPESYEGAQTFTTLVTRPVKTIIHPHFLSRYINSETGKKFVLSGQAGGAQKNLNVSVLKKLVVPVPSINEQDKISAILSSVDETIEKTEAVIEQTEKLKKGLMQQLFIKGIGHTKFKKTDVGEIPFGWEVVGIIDIAENEKNAVKPGPFGSSLKKEFYVKSGYKVYGQEQVIANDFTIGNYYIDDKKYEELNAFKVKPLDLLISLVGTFGKIAVVSERGFKPGIINPRLLKITFDKSKANVHFFKYYMSSSAFYQQLEEMSQGGTMGVINSKILKSIHFPLPSLDEQQRIVDILTNIDQKLDIETQKREQLQILKKGLMQSLLTGRIRVKTDEAEVTQV
ncbi:restriction endonuclease subunit S [Bacillus sp. AS_5]|uniref:restriction endonuclease subunit S n=1 Tax=Bacillus sp. AS_3 TaxID=2993439 RepID=UPI002AA2ABE8|nr:restriction endonuclease subunit S [Bacillus sp. AS_3]MCW4655796.1 restriction endonuclease subunit S [Bacillus sp. AS_3]MCX2701181.1 restriction endonuclease subunit S [Bacillus sp. AS_5]